MRTDLPAQYDICVYPSQEGLWGQVAFILEPFAKGDEYPCVCDDNFFCAAVQYFCPADGPVSNPV